VFIIGIGLLMQKHWKLEYVATAFALWDIYWCFSTIKNYMAIGKYPAIQETRNTIGA
jgi:hypothetical protein